MRNRIVGRSVRLWLLNIGSRCAFVKCDMNGHMYKKGDKVELWVNKVRKFEYGLTD